MLENSQFVLPTTKTMLYCTDQAKDCLELWLQDYLYILHSPDDCGHQTFAYAFGYFCSYITYTDLNTSIFFRNGHYRHRCLLAYLFSKLSEVIVICFGIDAILPAPRSDIYNIRRGLLLCFMYIVVLCYLLLLQSVTKPKHSEAELLPWCQ